MFHSDDAVHLPSGKPIELSELRWTELKIRVLTHSAPEAPSVSRMIKEGLFSPDILDVDTLSMTPVGSGGKCPHCGLVTIVTRGFPWGEDLYAKIPTGYCPHCHGAEDVG